MALENEIKQLHIALASRDRRIAGLELTLNTAAAKTLEKMEALRKIRFACEEELRGMAQIKTLEKSGADLYEVRIRELMKFMDGIETAVEKMYASRRWRFANFWRLLGRRFSKAKNRSARTGYHPLDQNLERYRAWRAMYLNDGKG